MMKINLLPRTINERKIVRNTAIMFGVLVVVVIAIGVLYTQMFMVPQVQAEQQLAQQTKDLEAEVVGIEKQRDEWKTKTEPVKKKLDFITKVLDYNLQYPKLYEEIGKWTYEKVAYTGLTCDGTQVAMAARAKSLEDVGRFLLNMYRATDLFTEVTISGVPGYPMSAPQSGGGGGMQMQMMAPGIPDGGGLQANLAGIGAIASGVQKGPAARYLEFAVNCKLKSPIVAPTFDGVGAANAQGAPGGMPGAPVAMQPPPGMPQEVSGSPAPGPGVP